MNNVFFDELDVPAPDVRLGCGGGTRAEQTGKIMPAYEQLCAAERPDACLVVGDVLSTLVCAIVAKKAGIPLAHVEAGLHSGDMGMPEEINRLVTDAITDWLFVTKPSALVNLRQECKDITSVFDVGHVMVENVPFQAGKLGAMDATSDETDAWKLAHARYGVVTFHRLSIVDDPVSQEKVARVLREVTRELPLIFPVHPRIRTNIEKHGIRLDDHVTLVWPQTYMSFLLLWKDAVVVITDSGEMQEEATALGVPCVTVRENTERLVTGNEGTCVLAGTDPDKVIACARQAIASNGKQGRCPTLWVTEGLA